MRTMTARPHCWSTVLVAGVPRVVMVMEYTAKGEPKILKIITDLAVFEVGKDGLTLPELAPEVTLEEVRSKTAAAFRVAPALAEA